MRPTKYPRFHTFIDAEEGLHDGNLARTLFDMGSAYLHAYYMVEISFRHPVMYFLFYRWWIPFFLHKEEQKKVDKFIRYIRSVYFRPYWAEFALYHPVQYCLFWIVLSLFEFIIKLFAVPVKIIKRGEKVEE